MAMSVIVRTALIVGAAAAMSGCTYYRSYETPTAAAPAPVVVRERAPDTVVVPDSRPNTVVVPAEPNTVIVPDRGPPRTIIVNPPRD
jgi:ABC-type Fe3+-hydroxamate transport system substrate-binding protein